ncbi:MAG: ThiF family adenylyltransferase [Candidatus Fimenecus sp.]
MDDLFARTALLLGDAALESLQQARVAVFGVGGVGGYVCEALARSGVGTLDLIDNDTVSISNRNRQIIALSSTVGREKTEVMRERLLDISPEMTVYTHNLFFTSETADGIDFTKYTYVVDAIDTVAGKIELAVRCQNAGVPLISSMGTGNKLHPERFEITDIYKTSVCPLARVMRTELRKRGVKKLKVVYSKEIPVKPIGGAPKENGRYLPGSTAFCPPAAGMIIAGAVVRDILGIE